MLSRPPPLHHADLERVRAILSGREQAFREFYDQAFPRLYRFALRHAGDPARAEELTQNTLVLALEKLDQYRGEASLLTWLFSIARHTLNRSGLREARLARFEDADSMEAALAAAMTGAAEVADPAQVVQQHELLRRVHSVLDRLPPLYADCLEGKYVLGLSVREMAERQQRSEKSVESTLTRAREAFRQAFTGGWEAETA